MRINPKTVYAWLEEDLPYFDLTTQVLGVGEQPARMAYYCRHAAVVCGTEEAAVLAREVGATVISTVSSGTTIQAQQAFLLLKAALLHSMKSPKSYKISLNMPRVWPLVLSSWLAPPSRSIQPLIF